MVAVLSQAPGAPAVRRMLIEVFRAFRSGTKDGPRLPSPLVPLTPAVRVNVEILDRAGFHAVRGRDLEAPSTKAAVRNAKVGLFLDMYLEPAPGSTVARQDVFELWSEYRKENALTPVDVKEMFRLVAAAGYADDGERFRDCRVKDLAGVPPRLSLRRDGGSTPPVPALAHRPAASALHRQSKARKP